MSGDVRERIARIIFDADNAAYTRSLRDEWWPADRDLYLGNADALIAAFPVLAGVTDEMVERAAEATWDRDEEACFTRLGTKIRPWSVMVAGWDEMRQHSPDFPHVVPEYRDAARVVLTAALGGVS